MEGLRKDVVNWVNAHFALKSTLASYLKRDTSYSMRTTNMHVEHCLLEWEDVHDGTHEDRLEHASVS